MLKKNLTHLKAAKLATLIVSIINVKWHKTFYVVYEYNQDKELRCCHDQMI